MPTATTETQALEARLLLAAAARIGIAPTVATSGTGVADMIAAASDRGAALVNARRSLAIRCKECAKTWSGVRAPEGSVDVGCPACDGELEELVDESRATAILSADGPVTVAAKSSPVSEAAAPSEPRQPAAALPARLGPYEIGKVLGRGGMGAVVAGHDPRTGQRVAIKLIAGWSATDLDARLRFEREGKVLTLLAHPHIVRFIERGEKDGQLYIIMELVEGASLSDRLEQGALPVAEAARIARAVAEGLAYAHALGLTHRDVKPGNVLLGTEGAVKLADFGLARRRDESLALTAPGTVVGTPVYMSPEQLEGAKAAPPADIYALGVMLYHMLAGAPPFEGSFAQIARQRQQGKIAPLRSKREDCPPAIAALVARMLASEATERPSATEVARALGTFEPPSTVTSAPRSPSAPAREARSLAAGERVGDFTIEGKLGAGGMGSVFKARRADGSVVALKLIARPLDAAASQRFAREARALSEVTHANVVRFLDAGESDGLSWIATELVPGRSLDAVVQEEGALAEKRLLDVAGAVSSALAALHAKKIVHRDVKPQNIMVRPDGSVVLVDLGLAKFLGANTAVTETGALVGTPHYMAPEQLLGRPVDARTDLYALGAALYHAATGKRPFDGETTTAVAFQQVNVTPAPVRAVNKKLSAPFGALVARLLEKRPERRPASAEAALALIARVRKGEPLDPVRTKLVRVVGIVIALLVAACVVAAWFAAQGKVPGLLWAGRDIVARAKPPAPAQEEDFAAAPAPAKIVAKDRPASPIPPADQPAPASKPATEPVPGGAAQTAKNELSTKESLGGASDEKKADGLMERRARSSDAPARRDAGAAVPALDANLVTVGQWKAYRAAAGGQAHFHCDPAEPKGFHHCIEVAGKDDAPVSGLDVWDAQAFARWADAALPTRAQWEKAAASGTLKGALAEWTLDLDADSARGLVARGSWLGGESRVEPRGTLELTKIGFRCVRKPKR